MQISVIIVLKIKVCNIPNSVTLYLHDYIESDTVIWSMDGRTLSFCSFVSILFSFVSFQHTDHQDEFILQVVRHSLRSF